MCSKHQAMTPPEAAQDWTNRHHSPGAPNSPKQVIFRYLRPQNGYYLYVLEVDQSCIV